MKIKLFSLLFLLLPCLTVKAQKQDSVIGVASYYANRFHGKKTASGETYNKEGYTCAHLKYGFGTKLRVRHAATGKEVIVKVTDRGPYNKRYSIDLSYAAAKDLGIIQAGHAKVVIFPYEESMEHEKPEANISSFMEFRITNKQLPHYAYKDTMKVKPLLLPINTADPKK